MNRSRNSRAKGLRRSLPSWRALSRTRSWLDTIRGMPCLASCIGALDTTPKARRYLSKGAHFTAYERGAGAGTAAACFS